jgi:hypothetical protein
VYALFTPRTLEDALSRAAIPRANPAFTGNLHLQGLVHLSEEALREATRFLRYESLPAANNDAKRAGRRFLNGVSSGYA